MTYQINLTEDNLLDFLNISFEIFNPLKGFLNSKDYYSVVNDMHLIDNTVWSIPITLEIPEKDYNTAKKYDKIILKDNNNNLVGEIEVEDIYKVDYNEDIKKIYGTDDVKHPGVYKEVNRSRYRVGGKIKLLAELNKMTYLDELFLMPNRVKEKIKSMGLKTVTGFQTRNPIHRAHEYLQRIALEVTDGLFIHPLIGWKKADDFSPAAIKAAYLKQIKEFYPENRVIFSVLQTPMRYAGPREAVFHAIIRRNYGCTHFIVGRDHAGVGGYYDKYEAQRLSSNISNLRIKILALAGPFYCKKCACIATENSCPHYDNAKENIIEISGTLIRKMIAASEFPPEYMMRKEVSEVLINLNKEGKTFGGYNE